MEKLARSLLEELNVETVFTIPLFGGIPVSESVVVTWIAMAVLIVIAFLLGRNLKVRNPGKRQQIAELIVLKLDAFTKKTLGEEATEYSTYMWFYYSLALSISSGYSDLNRQRRT